PHLTRKELGAVPLTASGYLTLFRESSWAISAEVPLVLTQRLGYWRDPGLLPGFIYPATLADVGFQMGDEEQVNHEARHHLRRHHPTTRGSKSRLQRVNQHGKSRPGEVPLLGRLQFLPLGKTMPCGGADEFFQLVQMLFDSKRRGFPDLRVRLGDLDRRLQRFRVVERDFARDLLQHVLREEAGM